MEMSTSRIPLRIRNAGPKRAQIDRNRVEVVSMDRKTTPELTPRQLAIEAIKVDAETRKKASSQPTNPFADVLHDECCSKCQPPDNYGIPIHWHHIPWDSVELKKHKLLDEKCQLISEVPILDEVELKARGLIDSDGRRRRPTEQMGADRGSQQLETVNGGKKVKHRPYIQMLPEVDDQKPSIPSSSSTSSIMLSARPSNSSSNNSQVVPTPKTLTSPGHGSSLNMAIETTPQMINAREPVVMTKTIETADGQFEFSINFEVRFKPKPKDTTGYIDM